jgi:hypothetical protein
VVVAPIVHYAGTLVIALGGARRRKQNGEGRCRQSSHSRSPMISP